MPLLEGNDTYFVLLRLGLPNNVNLNLEHRGRNLTRVGARQNTVPEILLMLPMVVTLSMYVTGWLDEIG